MTRDDKEQIIRAYWRTHQGRIGPTDGARAISEEYDIPVNTVRGIQYQLYDEESRPWDLEPLDPKAPRKECE